MSSPPPRHGGPGTSSSKRTTTGFAGADGLTGAVRGQSTALEYTLALALASLVITGLFLAAGDFVTNQREDVVRTELGVVGEQLADELVAADRLVQAGNTTNTLSVDVSMPATVAGADYVVEIGDTGSSQWLNLTSSDPEVAVTVRLETETDVETGRVQGGRVSIVYESGKLAVRG